MTQNSGIYCIYFECEDFQYYIGESSNIQNRFNRHKRDLIAGRHVNSNLQNGYHKFGTPSIYVLEGVEGVDLLREKEIHWISTFNSFHNGMNNTIGGEGCSYGEVHPSSLYSNYKYYEILDMLACTDYTIITIAKLLSVPAHIVSNVSTGKSANFLEPLYPQKYADMRNKVGTRKKGPTPMQTTLISPKNEIVEVYDLTSFSLENDLDLSGLYKLVRGTKTTVKGWRLHAA